MKYLVMETFNSYAVLLDEEGRFVKSANPGYEVGETVMDPVLMRDEPLEKVKGMREKRNPVVTGLIAVAAVVALFFGANFYQQNYAPYSSIFMVINPEVEMVLNRQGEVLDLKGANADGVVLLEGYEPSSQDKTVIANELVDRAIEMGFLADGGQVSIAIDTPDQELFEKYGIELREELDGRTTISVEITDGENKETPPPATGDDDDVEEDDDDADEDEDDDDDDEDEDYDEDEDDADDSDEDDEDEDDADEDYDADEEEDDEDEDDDDDEDEDDADEEDEDDDHDEDEDDDD